MWAWPRLNVGVSPMETVGTQLADDVAAALEGGLIITYCHRDYCGVGLRYHNGIFIYDESHDSTIATEDDLVQWQAQPSTQRKTFSSRPLFIAWLASQTDESLSGAELKLSNRFVANNQRLTIQRLRDATNFARITPKQKWPQYAG